MNYINSTYFCNHLAHNDESSAAAARSRTLQAGHAQAALGVRKGREFQGVQDEGIGGLWGYTWGLCEEERGP